MQAVGILNMFFSFKYLPVSSAVDNAVTGALLKVTD